MVMSTMFKFLAKSQTDVSSSYVTSHSKYSASNLIKHYILYAELNCEVSL